MLPLLRNVRRWRPGGRCPRCVALRNLLRRIGNYYACIWYMTFLVWIPGFQDGMILLGGALWPRDQFPIGNFTYSCWDLFFEGSLTNGTDEETMEDYNGPAAQSTSLSSTYQILIIAIMLLIGVYETMKRCFELLRRFLRRRSRIHRGLLLVICLYHQLRSLVLMIIKLPKTSNIEDNEILSRKYPSYLHYLELANAFVLSYVFREPQTDARRRIKFIAVSAYPAIRLVILNATGLMYDYAHHEINFFQAVTHFDINVLDLIGVGLCTLEFNRLAYN